MADTISLIDTQPEQPESSISFSDPVTNTMMDPEDADFQAQKTHFALGEASPGLDVLKDGYIRGTGDQYLRDIAVTQDALDQQKAKIAAVQQQMTADGTAQDPETIRLIAEQPTAKDPDTILESQYARKYVNGLASTNDGENGDLVGEAVAEAGDNAYGVLDAAQSIIERQEIANQLLLKADSDYKNSSWLRWGWDTVKSGLIPGYSWYLNHNIISSYPGSSILQGSNMAEQIANLYLLPPKKFKEQATAAYEQLAKSSIGDARAFAQALISYTNSDEVAANAGNITEAVLTAAGSGAVRRLVGGMRGIVSANAGRVVPANALAASGNVAAAADEVVYGKLQRVVDPAAPTGTPERVLSEYAGQNSGILDPRVYARSAGSLANERVQRIVDNLQVSANRLLSSLTEAPALPRVLTQDAIAKSVEQAKQSLLKDYPQINNAILDATFERTSEKSFGGVDTLNLWLGQSNKALPFKTEKNAEFWASNMYRLPKGSYDVVQENGNYMIRVARQVDENSDIMRELRVGTDNQAPVPTNIMQYALGWLRGSDDVLSKSNNAIRKELTFATSAVTKYVSDAFKDVGKMGRAKVQRLEELLEQNSNTMRTVVNNGQSTQVKGKWFDSFDEYSTAYHARYGELPSDQEITSYFKVRQLQEMEDWIDNLSQYRDLVRLGHRQNQFSFLNPTTNQVEMSDWFDGRPLDKLPAWDSKTPFTVLYRDKTGKVSLQLSSKMPYQGAKGKVNVGSMKWFEDEIAAGRLRVIKPRNPYEPALQKLLEGNKRASGEIVDYVVVPTPKAKPLSPIRVQPREGPKEAYSAKGWFAKQGTVWRTGMGRTLRSADKTMLYSQSETIARRTVDNLNKAREMVLQNVPKNALDDFVSRNLPFRDGDEFKAQFRQYNVNGQYLGNTAGHYDINSPFVAAQRGERVKELNKKLGDALDVVTSEHSDFQYFSHSFDDGVDTPLMRVDSLGTPTNPTVKAVPSPAMDVASILNRSAVKLVRSRFLPDYQRMAVEDWAKQFGNLLEDSAESIQNNPLKALVEGKFRKSSGLSYETAAAKNARRAILQLIGQRSTTAQAFYAMRDKVLSKAIDKLGPKAGAWLEPYLWTEKSDPLRMARSMSFSLHLGMWNPVQLWLQASQVSHAAAITGNPIRAAQAMHAAMMMQFVRQGEFNPKYTSVIGKAVQKVLGIDNHTFNEMYNAARRQGILNVGGEVSQLDNAFEPKLFSGAKGTIYDSSTIFFRKGEGYARLSAFNMAYLEFRKANPTKALTATDLRAITARADTLNLNMTRASNNAILNRGVPAFVGQFFTYHSRLAEQLWGGRLTAGEKARVLMMNAALYGIPTGIGGSAFGVAAPVYEMYRQYFLENGGQFGGVDFNQAKLNWMLEGIPHMLLQYLTGEDLAIASRYGPNGMTFFRDLIVDKDASVLMGPGGSSIASLIQSFEPFTYSLASLFSNDANKEFPITAQDFTDALQNMSSVSNAAKAYYAWNSGKVATKSGLVLGEASKTDAAIIGLFGIQPVDVNDTMIMTRDYNRDRESRDELIRYAQKQYQLGMQAAADGNSKDALVYFKRSKAVIMGSSMNYADTMDAFNKISGSVNDDLYQSIGEKFILHAPEDQIQQRLDRYQSKQGAE